MLSASTALEVLDVAKAHRGDPSLWAADVRVLLTQALTGSLGIAPVRYRAHDRSLCVLSPQGDASEAVCLAGHASFTRAQCREVYETSTFVRTSSSYYLGGTAPPELAEGMGQLGIADVLGVAQPMANGREALGFTVLLDAGLSLERREVLRWGALARQLAALADARVALERLADPELIDPAALTRAQNDDDAMSAVARALVELDRRRARSLRSESAAAEALDLWEELLTGGWAVVEHGQIGGRRRLVAVRVLDTQFQEARMLSDEERQVVVCAARGLTNKEIAFELSLNEATVATRLRRGLRRLGVQRRVELVRIAQALGLSS